MLEIFFSFLPSSCREQFDRLSDGCHLSFMIANILEKSFFFLYFNANAHINFNVADHVPLDDLSFCAMVQAQLDICYHTSSLLGHKFRFVSVPKYRSRINFKKNGSSNDERATYNFSRFFRISAKKH